MQLLSYNPQDDEYFIGLSEAEFERLDREHKIQYESKSDYEKEKLKAKNSCDNKEYNQMIMEYYQTETVPFVCIVSDRNGSAIVIRPKHFPFDNLWNGYSPWQRIAVKEIDNLNFHTVEIEYMEFPLVLQSFCDEWIEIYSDENVDHHQLIENDEFSNYCRSFGWSTDNGESFKQKYPCESYDEALQYLDQVTEIDLLGNLIFSRWRHFNHWAWSGEEILDHKEWFVKLLSRLKELAVNC